MRDAQLGARSRGRLRGIALGLAMGLSNAISYLLVALLSRSLGPADFGGYSALSTVGILLAIPAGAFQLAIARRQHSPSAPSGLGASLAVGTGLTALTAAVAVPLADALDLDSPWAVVFLALTLVPMTTSGALQGVLLGQERLRPLALSFLLVAGGRLAAVVVAVSLDLSTSGVFGALLVGNTVAGLATWLLARPALRRAGGDGRVLGDVTRASGALLVFMALTGVDVLLARNYLSPDDSGGYALTATFARALCWGTQFVVLLVIPRMARDARGQAKLRAVGVVLGLGLLALAVVLPAPGTWIRIAGGEEYAGYQRLLLGSLVVGILWAMIQVLLLADAGGTPRLAIITTGVLAAQVAAVALWWHHSTWQILWTTAGAAATVLAVGLLSLRSESPRT